MAPGPICASSHLGLAPDRVSESVPGQVCMSVHQPNLTLKVIRVQSQNENFSSIYLYKYISLFNLIVLQLKES